MFREIMNGEANSGWMDTLLVGAGTLSKNIFGGTI